MIKWVHYLADHLQELVHEDKWGKQDCSKGANVLAWFLGIPISFDLKTAVLLYTASLFDHSKHPSSLANKSLVPSKSATVVRIDECLYE